jgi:FtsH-binding integral membrane protein
MSLKKANFNVKKDWLTTVTGIIALVIPILSLVGLLTPEQSTSLQNNLGVIANSLGLIIGAIASIVLMFSGKTA